MPVLGAEVAGTEEAQAAAWQQAVAERGKDAKGEIFVTGSALANEDQELARNRRLAGLENTPMPSSDVDPKRAFRAPLSASMATDAPAQSQVSDRPLQAHEMKNLYVPPQEVEAARAPIAEAPAPAATAPTPIPEDDEGLRLERDLLGVPASGTADDIPDESIKIGGRDVPLSHVREGLEARRDRQKWQAELTQKSQATAAAFRKLMGDVADGLKTDLIGSARKIGMSNEDIAAQLQANGLAPLGNAPFQPQSVATLPEDADPTTKRLFQEKQQLERAVSQQSREIREIRESMDEERRQRSDRANEQARMATLSGVKSELKTKVALMPSMRDPDGKLSKLGDVLVDSTMLLLNNEVSPGQIPEHAAVRARAFDLFGQQAREKGITSKADQARRAIEGKKAPIPTRPGTTVQSVHPGAAAGPRPLKLESVDFSNDEERKAAARAWWALNIGE